MVGTLILHPQMDFVDTLYFVLCPLSSVPNSMQFEVESCSLTEKKSYLLLFVLLLLFTDSSEPAGCISRATQGNFLECLNLTVNRECFT